MHGAMAWCVTQVVHFVIAHHMLIDPSLLVRYCAGAFVL